MSDARSAATERKRAQRGPDMTERDLCRAVYWLCRYHYRGTLDQLAAELTVDNITINVSAIRDGIRRRPAS